MTETNEHIYHKCNKKDGFCDILKARIKILGQHGSGMFTYTVMDGSAPVGQIGMKTIGILYKTDVHDIGLMLNYCPFCGEKIDWFRETEDNK